MKSYTKIANDTGLSISHISRVMRGKSRPSVETLMKLAWELEMSAEEFVRRYKVVGRWRGNGRKIK